MFPIKSQSLLIRIQLISFSATFRIDNLTSLEDGLAQNYDLPSFALLKPTGPFITSGNMTESVIHKKTRSFNRGGHWTISKFNSDNLDIF